MEGGAGTPEAVAAVLRFTAPFDFSGIDISHLGTGHHTLYFRLQDSDGNWGVIREVHFEIYERGTIQAAEYYVVDEEDAPRGGLARAEAVLAVQAPGGRRVV